MEDETQTSDGLREIPASEILAKIKKGELVEYDHVIIKGDLDIDMLGQQEDDTDFIILTPIKIINSQIDGFFSFAGTNFKDAIDFSGSKFNIGANFEYSQFNGKADFARTYFNGVTFLGAQFNKRADFSWTTYKRGNFTCTHFYELANFFGAQFDEYISFYRAIFDDKANFLDAKISGEDSPEIFKAAKFKRLEDEETVCRKAKKLMEEQGNKTEADNYFYREMGAGRRLKPHYIRYPEYIFMQLIFGYGVHPRRLIIWWGIIVIAFGILYWIGNGIKGAAQLFDYIKFSFGTAIAPGYIATIINPGSTGYRLNAEYQAIAMAETIVGTFLWAGFIATFARKYMR